MSSICAHVGCSPITTAEKAFLKEFIDVMGPLAAALDILQSDSSTAGTLLPTLHTLFGIWSNLTKCNDGQPKRLEYLNGLVNTLAASVKNRFCSELSSDYFVVAACLEPRFKIHWVEDDKVDEVICMVRHTLLSECPAISFNVLDEIDLVEEEKSFFHQLEKKAKTQTNNNAGDVWLSWANSADQKLPSILESIYRKYNTSLASSAPVERLFSLGKRILSPNRSLLSDEHFEQMLMVAMGHYSTSNK
jgi:hypothetical protein